MISNGRVARLTALALATGTLVAAGAGTAGAATTTDLTTFTTQGGGTVLRLEVNLPVDLGLLPQKLVQDVVMTGTASRSGLDPVAIANSLVGQESNNISVVSDVLSMKRTAEYGKPSSGDQNLLGVLSGLGISANLLALKSVATNPNVVGTTAASHSALADLRIDGLGDLNLQAALDSVASTLSGLLGTAKLPVTSTALDGTVTTTVTTVTGLLTGLSDQIADLLDSTTADSTKGLTDVQRDALDQVATLLNALPAALAGQLKSTAADSSLLRVGLLESTQNVTRQASSVTSVTNNVLADISVLGGLVTVEGLKSEAVATLGDAASSAVSKTTTQGNLLKVNAADLLRVEVADDLQVLLSSGVLPAEITDVVNGVLGQVTGLVTDLLGVHLELGKVTHNVETADRAAATVSAATLTIDPQNPLTGARLLPMDAPLIEIGFVPATAEVVKAQAAAPPVELTTPAAASSKPVLARTGAELPLTGAVAAGLLGLAAVARRRRMLTEQ